MFSRRGFTLIELLVVIAIIGILASVVLVSLSGAREKSFNASREAQIAEFIKALESHYSEHGSYPDVASPACLGDHGGNCGVFGTGSEYSNNAILDAALAPYFNPLPAIATDPIATTGGGDYIGISYTDNFSGQAYAINYYLKGVDECRGGSVVFDAGVNTGCQFNSNI